jgi:hypothetical protein
MNDYVVCWKEPMKNWPTSIGPKWEVVSGYDAMQERVSDLVEDGILEDDIVVGEITNDTN